MKQLKTLIVVSAAAAIFTGLVLFSQRAPGENLSTLSAKPQNAPAWTLTDLDGKTIHSTDFKGKVVILDFWATWCGPCRAEIPEFIDLQKQYAKQGLVVVGVSVDEAGPAAVRLFAQKLGMNYRVGVADEKMLDAFGDIEALPTTFVINRAGRIVDVHVGLTDKEDFEKEIEPLLNP